MIPNSSIAAFSAEVSSGGFDDPDERAGRSLDGAVNFPSDRLFGHLKATA
jgi:hypothetical protein